MIEVSTFRAYLDNSGRRAGEWQRKTTSKLSWSGMQHAVDASGRVLRDNVWGPQDEDATRRDFTVNAMYYDPVSQVVVDFHKGIQDAKKKTLRMIGDPPLRYREDPVRIIRAVRLPPSSAPWASPSTPSRPRPWCSRRPCWPMPQSRMFDEMLAAANRPRHCHHRAIAQAGHGQGHLPAAGRGCGARRHACW